MSDWRPTIGNPGFELDHDPRSPTYLQLRVRAGHCQICGTPLTDPRSIQRGIGPECLRKQRREARQTRQFERAAAEEVLA